MSSRHTSDAHGFSRRAFFHSVLAGSAGAVGAAQLAGCASAPPSAGTVKAGRFQEPANTLPYRDDADVIVCGAGPAGVSAAIAAARTGARVRLFDRHGCLGGVWTAGLLTYIFDFDKPGLTRELTRKLDARDARRNTDRSRFCYDPEAMKVILDELCGEHHVKTQIQTRVAAAYRTGRRLTTVITESKSGREAWSAPVFIDATGDGDLGAQAGCGWDFGNPEDGTWQPLTLNALAVVRDVRALAEYISFYNDNNGRHIEAVEAFKRELKRAGIETSYGHPTLFHIRDNLLDVMINHEYGVKPFDAAQLSEATARARAEVHRAIDALRALGGPWAGMQVVASAEQIGIRDGRRIRGRYTVTREDLIQGARHPDAVCRATFNVDIHAPSHEKNRQETISHGGFRTKPYDIPLRALIAQDADGLMMAGRCISGEFIAHASYRVTGNSVATGEAAGVVAALAARAGRPPHEIAWADAAAVLAKWRT